MALQLRPKGSDPNAPMYNPERDIAYITRTLMTAAVSHLEQNRWSPELAELFAHHEITPDDLSGVVGAFADSQLYYVGAETEATPGDALARCGFFAHKFVARQALLAAIGEVLVGAYFRAVRDVTYVGEAPTREIADFVAAGRSAARRMHGASEIPSETLEADCIHLRSQVSLLTSQLQSLQEAHQELQRQVEQVATLQPAEATCPKPSNPQPDQ